MYYMYNMLEVEKMKEVKERHNITLPKDIWKILKALKFAKRKSISELIEDAVKEMVRGKKYNSVYFKIMASKDFCDEKENKELTEILDSLEDEDLEVVESYEI